MADRSISVLAILAVVTACGGSATSVTMPPPPPPPFIGLVAGDVQIGGVGAPLGVPLQVLVTQSGVPLANQTVVWQAANGSISPSQSVTSATGNASASWTLGGTPGPQSAAAYVGNVSGASLTFSAVGAVVAPGTSVEVDLYAATGARYEPAAVIIQAGTTVNWVWKDGTHSVVPYGATSFASSASGGPPRTYSVTFNTPGTYRYYCLEHGAPGSGMNGVVVVQ